MSHTAATTQTSVSPQAADWRLPAHLRATAHGDDVVLLDLRDANYLVLAGAGAALRPDPASDFLRIADDALAAELDAAGLIVRASPGAAAVGRPVLPRAARDLPDAADLVPRGGEVAALMWVAAETAWRVRFSPFARLVGERAPERPAGDGAALLRRAQVFDRLLPWIPWQGECLQRAAMLRRFLQRDGLDAAWVFGVRTWPFRAHCWLQAGDLVLGDRLERVVGYSPVMIV